MFTYSRGYIANFIRLSCRRNTVSEWKSKLVYGKIKFLLGLSSNSVSVRFNLERYYVSPLNIVLKACSTWLSQI